MMTRIRLLTFAFTAMLSASAALALERDELALICNRKVPGSVELAKFYAQTRGVPEDHIIELDLPGAEHMTYDKFDSDVVLPVRKALLKRNLKASTKCLVTFYGVPLRLLPPVRTKEEREEAKVIAQERESVTKQVSEVVVQLEQRVAQIDASFKPAAPGAGPLKMEQSVQRADAAMKVAARVLDGSSDPQVRQAAIVALIETVGQLSGPAGLLRTLKPNTAVPPLPGALPSTRPVEELSPEERWELLKQQYQTASTELVPALDRRFDAAARQRARQLVRDTFGLVEYYKLLQLQADYLTDGETSALDQELAMLWINAYPRQGMLPNPLHYRTPAAGREKASVVMVMRIDGVDALAARELIQTSRKVESQGLRGRFVIDSRGIAEKKGDGSFNEYGRYDQRLRNLAELISRRTALSVFSDDTEKVIAPRTCTDVALYCGWYSLRNYVPSCQFAPGAVGFHIASAEMISLRDPNERGWCHGLLNGGVVATLGPVDEPYLTAFPDPVDFFGLLLSGKYTLAEVYWLTSPFVSWRISMVGDPLYKPFERNPAIKPEHLPEPLREFVGTAASEMTKHQ